MNDFRVTLTGPAYLLDALEAVFRTCGIATERGLESSYDGVAVSVPALYAVASREVLARCISAHRLQEKAPHKVTYFVSGKGSRVIQDYSAPAIAAALAQAQHLSYEVPPEVPRV
jgi:hypothetical protein